MATKYQLSWRASEKRWRKRYKGKDYYFAAPEGKVASYQRCLAEWKRKKAEIDRADEETADKKAWELVLDQIEAKMAQLEQEDQEEHRKDWLYWRQALVAVKEAIKRGEPYFYDEEQGQETDLNDPVQVPIVVPDIEPLGTGLKKGEPPPWELMERTPEEPEPETTIAGNVASFLERKKGQVERGERSHGRYDALRVALESFTTFAGGHKPVESIDGQLLARWRDRLETRAASGEMSLRYAKDHLQAVKQFVTWCWEHDLIEFPRILKSREFSIAAPEQTVEVFTVDEVRRLIEGAGEPLRLHLLLMLNCGMQQSDIAELRHDEVDWEAGRIERKRSKTKKHRNVPKVVYQLWPETFELLKAHRSHHPELVLTNRNGSPLLVQRIVEGKVKKTDNIRSAYRRLVAKLANGNPPVKIAKPMKHLRKTSASKLGEHPEYARYAQHFLGHAPTTVADRHYVRPSQEQFGKALPWLRRELLGV